MISAEEFLRRHPVAPEGDAGHPVRSAREDGIRVDDALTGGAHGPSFCDGAGNAIDENAIDENAPDDDGDSRAARPSRFSRWGKGNGEVEDPSDADACREAALRLLDAAARSSGMLRGRLLDKGYAAGVVDEVIDRLTELHLLDDRDYAESVVRYCAGRMMGRRGTVMELTRKGVDRALATSVADEAESEGVFEEAAWELGRQVARRTRGLERQVRQRRLWSAGGRKGHDPETLRRVAHELLD
ncbi:RecX family transcriptional regulator [Bifidobacterium callitrichos]|uniref:Regulatory protein RecX n=1 Tax=Bifidobacterium callitrichos TaxID=762209 RepID=A0A5M9ZDZ1_9BIFI|nr:regulatory protein RecX [Bifidobacterium callitrichos]KAA8817351.1 RecX family transcriptional regulator [Bifidobacterium callitrichos]